MSLTLEDLTGPDRATIDHRWERMDTLCGFIDDLDSEVQNHLYLSNRVLWHYAMYLKGADVETPWLTCTVEFEGMDDSQLREHAQVVLGRVRQILGSPL